MLDVISHPLIMKSVLLVINILYLLSLMYIMSKIIFLYYATTKSFFTSYLCPLLFRRAIDVYTVKDCWFRIKGLRFAIVPSKFWNETSLDYSVNTAIFVPRFTIFWITVPCLFIFPWRWICFIRAVLPGSWFLRLFRFKPFSISMLLNWLQVIYPLLLLSASWKSWCKHKCIF